MMILLRVITFPKLYNRSIVTTILYLSIVTTILYLGIVTTIFYVYKSKCCVKAYKSKCYVKSKQEDARLFLYSSLKNKSVIIKIDITCYFS